MKLTLKGLKRVLGVLTDILSFGRAKGWWKKGHWS